MDRRGFKIYHGIWSCPLII